MRTRLYTFFVTLTVSAITVGVTVPANAADFGQTEYSITVPDGAVSSVVDTIIAEGGTVKQSSEELNTIVADLPQTDAVKIDSINGVVVEDKLNVKLAEVSPDALNPSALVNISTLSWGLDRTDQKLLPLNSTYTYPSDKAGQGVYVYVVDTGIKAHEQFENRILKGYDGINDGQGTSDCYGHGTHVAGIIGGSTVGVAPDSYLIPVRVFNCSGAATGTGFYGGLQFILDDWAAKGYPPAVVNMSLSGDYDAVLNNAISVMHDAGLFIAVAAGNESTDACTKSPASSPDAVTVGATTSTDVKASYSNYGSCVDIFAPGNQITSAYITNSTGLAFMSGTSMASPHVAGAAARYLSAFNDSTPSEVKDAINGSASSNILSSVGVNSPNKLLYVNPNGFAKLPTAPNNVAAVAGLRGTIANISWNAPTSNGGATIDNYIVSVSPSTGVTGSTSRDAGAATSYSFTGLTPGVEYTFTVTAVNFMGAGPSSVSSALTLQGSVPNAPTNVTAVQDRSVGGAVVAWNAPVYDGNLDITGYTVSYVPTDASESAVNVNLGNVLTTNLTSLTHDKEYRVTVKAVNSLGSSVSSTLTTVTVLGIVPNNPSGLATVQKVGTVDTVKLTWTASTANAGPAVTGYTVTVSPSTGVVGLITRSAGLNTSFDFTGLNVNTAYTFTVKAQNSDGDSTGVSSSAVTLKGSIANAPTGLAATPIGFGQVNLSWAAPTFTGGVPITGYILTAVPAAGGTTKTYNLSNKTSVSVTGLTAGVLYNFKVSTVNQYGTSVTGATVQGKPYGQSSTVRNITVSYPQSLKSRFAWNVPLNLGGSALLRYEVRWTTDNANIGWSAWNSAGLTTSYVVPGIPRNVTRYVEIRAVTAAGNGIIARYAFRPTI